MCVSLSLSLSLSLYHIHTRTVAAFFIQFRQYNYFSASTGALFFRLLTEVLSPRVTLCGPTGTWPGRGVGIKIIKSEGGGANWTKSSAGDNAELGRVSECLGPGHSLGINRKLAGLCEFLGQTLGTNHNLQVLGSFSGDKPELGRGVWS